MVANLTEKQLSTAKQISSQTWLSLLENEKTDFASDVILNSIHHKGDPMFYVLQDFRPEKRIKIWKKFDKADEIQYWKRYFEKQDSINQVKK